VKVTMKALRCIDKKGGIDNYILFTDEKGKREEMFVMNCLW
jgi:ribosomal protein L28